MASGALRVLRQRGLRVPEDVAVVGFDDMVSVAEWTDPPLTTIRQDIEEMGRLMARLLLRALEPPPTRRWSALGLDRHADPAGGAGLGVRSLPARRLLCPRPRRALWRGSGSRCRPALRGRGTVTVRSGARPPGLRQSTSRWWSSPPHQFDVRSRHRAPRSAVRFAAPARAGAR